ncbi:MAG: hypothetical protein RIC89_00305 [Pseudomonadales bacterium]
MGRLEELTNSQRNALSAMGVQLYFARPAEAPAAGTPPPAEVKAKAPPEVEPVEPPVVPLSASAPSIAPIRFDWVRGGGGLLWVDQIAQDQQAFVQDVVRFLDWRFNCGATGLQSGTFQWPQLTATEGSPRRPLAAFYAKQCGGMAGENRQPAWLLVDGYVAEEVLTHLDELGAVPCFVLEQFAQAVSDPSAKRALWQTITK